MPHVCVCFQSSHFAWTVRWGWVFLERTRILASISGAWNAQDQKKQDCMRGNTLLACRPHIRADRDRPVAWPAVGRSGEGRWSMKTELRRVHCSTSGLVAENDHRWMHRRTRKLATRRACMALETLDFRSRGCLRSALLLSRLFCFFSAWQPAKSEW